MILDLKSDSAIAARPAARYRQCSHLPFVLRGDTRAFIRSPTRRECLESFLPARERTPSSMTRHAMAAAVLKGLPLVTTASANSRSAAAKLRVESHMCPRKMCTLA